MKIKIKTLVNSENFMSIKTSFMGFAGLNNSILVLFLHLLYQNI